MLKKDLKLLLTKKKKKIGPLNRVWKPKLVIRQVWGSIGQGTDSIGSLTVERLMLWQVTVEG